MLLPELLADEAFRLFLVFCRVGAALLILPGFGEPSVPPRLRLLLALALSLLLGAALGPGGGLLPAAAPEEPAALALLVGRVVLIGLFLGAAARTLLGALHVAGSVIAYQSGLAAASVFDPGAATQGTLPGNLLTTAALVLLFVTDGHHALLAALADSSSASRRAAPGCRSATWRSCSAAWSARRSRRACGSPRRSSWSACCSTWALAPSTA